MPPPRKVSPRRRERRTRSRSYSPRPSYRRRSGSRSPRDKRRSSPEWKRSPPRRRSISPRERSRSPRQVARRSPQRRSPPRRSRSPQRRSRSPQRRSRSLSYEKSQPVKRVPADSSGKRSYRSRSPSPIQVKRSRDERDYREEPKRGGESRRDESRRYSPPTSRSQERGYSPRGRSPSPRHSSGLRESPHAGKMYADKPSSSRAPLFPVGKRREEISSVTVVNKTRLEKLDKRFQTLEQLSRGSFDFEENITIGIHRGPQHVSLDEDVPVNYNFNTKSFLMLFPKKETHKAIFDRDEILQFHHDDILDEEAYVEKRTITVQPTPDKPKPRWSDSVDYKITIGKSSRDEEYSSSDRRMVRDSGRRRSSRDPEVTVRLDPKPDPRYEKLFRDSQRRTARSRSRSRDREPMIRDPHDLRHNLNKRHGDDFEGDKDRDRGADRGRDVRRDDRGMVDARRKIEARRSDQGGSLDRGTDIRITRMEQKERRRSEERLRKERGRASMDKELPDFKNRPEKFNFESWKEKPEITPKGSSYYQHDERNRDDMNYWERKQHFLATGQNPRSRPPLRGRGSFRGRGAPRPFRGRGSSFSRGSYTPNFVPRRDTTNEVEWKHDKFSEIDKETDKDSKKETDKHEGKDKHKKKKTKDKDKTEKKKKDKKDKSKGSKEKESKEIKKEKEKKSEKDTEEGDKEKSKSNGDAKGKDGGLETENVGPNFSNLLTLT